MLEIGEDIKFQTKKGSEEATNRLSVKFTVVEDESEEGNSFFQNYDLGKPGGQKALAILLLWTKMAAQIEKKYKIEKEAADLSEKEWGTKYLDITAEDDTQRALAQKIIHAFIAKGPGKTFYAQTKAKPNSWIDKDSGEKKEGVNVNMPKMKFNTDSETKKEIKDRLDGKTGEQKPPPAAAAPADTKDEEPWPED
jgi:hypothetical protein